MPADEIESTAEGLFVVSAFFAFSVVEPYPTTGVLEV